VCLFALQKRELYENGLDRWAPQHLGVGIYIVFALELCNFEQRVKLCFFVKNNFQKN
jgi:hypothetical protein